jgi:acyl-CoA thioesterase FadM
MLEIARIEYCREALEIPIDAGTFVEHDKYFFVRNALDYFSPAIFDEPLLILTRVATLGRTSVTIEQVIESERDRRRILEAEAVMVSVDPKTNRPIDLDPILRKKVVAWESPS